MTYRIEDLFSDHGEELNLKIIGGKKGVKREIVLPEVHRPGLCLAGYLKGYANQRILIFGDIEINYLFDLSQEERLSRLQGVLTQQTPAVIVTRSLSAPQDLLSVCEEKNIPLFCSNKPTLRVMHRLTILLLEEFAPSVSCHGSFVEVFGVGLLIQGNSSVGKSEAALGLIERGHRLISDDIVKVKEREGYLEGVGFEVSRYHMEVRGIGIINIANLYGAVCVREKKTLDIVVKLEVWDDRQFYDRLGIDEKKASFLGIEVPLHILPVKPGRDVVLLLETLALNHRLKKMGYHAAKKFDQKLLTLIDKSHDKAHLGKKN